MQKEIEEERKQLYVSFLKNCESFVSLTLCFCTNPFCFCIMLKLRAVIKDAQTSAVFCDVLADVLSSFVFTAAAECLK